MCSFWFVWRRIYSNLRRIISEAEVDVLTAVALEGGLTKQPWECRRRIFRRTQDVHACIILTYIMLPRVRI